MTDRINLQLNNAQDGHKALMYAWTRYAKPRLIAGHRLQLQIQPETRSDRQNRFLHAMLGDIAHQVEWAGKKRDPDVWKRLLVAAWCRARREQVELLPALDGHGVDIVFRSTSQLTRAECAELCDFIQAWATEHDVELRDAVPWQVDPETGEIAE